jgi:hypothetical protein
MEKNHSKLERVLIIAWVISGLTIFCYSSYAEIKTLKTITFDATDLKDPFKSLLPEKKIEIQPGIEKVLEPVVTAPVIEIQGIIWGGKFPQAIINNCVLKEGESLDGAEPIIIVGIKSKEVVVLFKNKIFTYAH